MDDNWVSKLVANMIIQKYQSGSKIIKGFNDEAVTTALSLKY